MSEDSAVRRRREQAISRVLVDVARGLTPRHEPAMAADPAGFVAAVRYHRLAPLAHTLLRERRPGLAGALRGDRDRALAMHLHATGLLGVVGGLFTDLPWAAFKGPVLSEIAHPIPGLRSYGDIDLLVAPGDLRTATSRLLGAGWTIADYDDMLRNPAVPGEMHWRSPSGALMDLHWSMINTADRRRRVVVPTGQLLERRARIQLGFSSAWTLDPEDGFVHVCLHAALTGANRLLYLVDAQHMAARVTDWDAVAARATSWRAAGHVALVLRRARACLGGELPGGLDRRLGISRMLRALLAGVDAAAPVAGARAEPGIARLVARAVQPGAAATVSAVSRSLVSHVQERIRPPRSTTGRRTPAGTDALARYLDRVEAASREPAI